jgi:hypothetical protein
MSDLAAKHCVPRQGGVPPLRGAEPMRRFVECLPSGAVIQKRYGWRMLSWGQGNVNIYTHKIRGVSKSDFVVAAKVDRECFAGLR